MQEINLGPYKFSLASIWSFHALSLLQHKKVNYELCRAKELRSGLLALYSIYMCSVYTFFQQQVVILNVNTVELVLVHDNGLNSPTLPN